VMSTT